MTLSRQPKEQEPKEHEDMTRTRESSFDDSGRVSRRLEVEPIGDDESVYIFLMEFQGWSLWRGCCLVLRAS